ncbi:MAG: hypothetical protein EBY22_07530 [Gammaproteobacteria bacterium]|nr:hypothetical protein [Gammaproteobacteria bacterium]
MACQPIWNELKLITLIIKIFYIGAKGRFHPTDFFILRTPSLRALAKQSSNLRTYSKATGLLHFVRNDGEKGDNPTVFLF